MIHPFSNYHEPFLAGVLLNQKMTTRVLLMSSPCYVVTLPAQPFCMGYPEELCWTWFDILIYASTTQKVICSFELSLFSCLLTLVYQLIVKSMRAIIHRYLLLLWSVKPFYSGMTRRNKLQYLIHIQDWVKAVVLRKSMPIQLLICSTSEYYPFMSGLSWELHHLSWTLDIVILLAIIIHPSVPCCRNRNIDKWIVMCEINTPSNLVAG